MNHESLGPGGPPIHPAAPSTMADAGQSEAGDGSVAGWLAWSSVAILLLLNIFSHVDRTIIALMVDPIKRSLGIDDVGFSLLQGLAFTVFYGFASLPMGWLADRFSRHWVIYLGVTSWSICTAACGLAGSFWHMFLARLGVGAGEATLYPASYALIGDLFPPAKVATAAGVLAAGGAIGASLAFVIGGAAISWAESIPPVSGFEPWQLVFVMVGLPGLLLAPLVFLIPRRKVRTAEDGVGHVNTASPGYLSWLRSNAGFFVPMFLGIGCSAVEAVGCVVWVPSYLIRHFGMDVGQAGLIMGFVNGVPGVIGFVGGGWIIDRLTSRGVKNAHVGYFVIAATIVAVSGFTAFMLPGSLVGTLFFLSIVNLCVPLTGPAIGLIQQTTPAHYRARTTAILFVIMYMLSMALGPFVVAMFSEKIFGGPEQVGSGLALLFAIFGPLAIISFLATYYHVRRRRAEGESVDARHDTGPGSA